MSVPMVENSALYIRLKRSHVRNTACPEVDGETQPSQKLYNRAMALLPRRVECFRSCTILLDRFSHQAGHIRGWDVQILSHDYTRKWPSREAFVRCGCRFRREGIKKKSPASLSPVVSCYRLRSSGRWSFEAPRDGGRSWAEPEAELAPRRALTDR